MSLQTAKSLQAERAAEQCRDLRAVLNLLIHITQSDLSGGEDDDGLGHSLVSVAPAGVLRTRNRHPARQPPTPKHPCAGICMHVTNECMLPHTSQGVSCTSVVRVILPQ